MNVEKVLINMEFVERNDLNLGKSGVDNLEPCAYGEWTKLKAH